MALAFYPNSGSRTYSYIQKRSGAVYTPPDKSKATGEFVDTNDSFRLKYNKNGTVVTLLDSQGGVGGAARLPVFNTTDKAMGNAAGGGAQGAVTLFTVTTAALNAAGGWFTYNLFITDGTDIQSLSGNVEYSQVNKAGTLTQTIQEATIATVQAKAVSAGTVTIAWTMTDGGSGVGSIKCNVTTSLTPTTDAMSFTVVPVRGTVVLV